MKIRFFVNGIPYPGGSKKAFYSKKQERSFLVDAGGKNTKDWRTSVKQIANETYDGPPLDEAVQLTINFYKVRPKSHYGTGRNANVLKPSAPEYPITRPDTTKLIRSTEDALSDSGIWRDDSLVVRQFGTKDWADRPGAWITIETMDEVES